MDYWAIPSLSRSSSPLYHEALTHEYPPVTWSVGTRRTYSLLCFQLQRKVATYGILREIALQGPSMPRSRLPFFYGWWVVAAAATIVFMTGGIIFYGFSALINPMAAETGWSRAALGGGYSVRSEVGGIAAPLVGIAVDRLGPRRILLSGVCIVALGLVLLSRIHSLWQFYVAMTVLAIGTSACGGNMGWVAAANWFRRQRARAMSVITVGAGLSGIIVPVFAWLIARFGWREALLISAGGMLAVGIPMTLVVRDRPESYGLLPDGDPSGPASPTAPAVHPERTVSTGQALRSRAFWAIAIAAALGNLTGSAVMVHVIPALINVGISQELTVLAATGVPVLSLGGRVAMGWIADFVDKRYVLAIAFLLQAVGVLLFAGITAAWMIVPFLLIYTTGFGGAIPVRPALQAEVFGISAFGAIQGLLLAISTLGAVVGPLAVGHAFDVTGSYQGAFLALGLISLLSVPLMFLVPAVRSPRPLTSSAVTQE